MAREINELSDPEVGRKRLSGRFGGHDFSHLPLDRPLAPEDFPDPGSVAGGAQPHRGDPEPGAARASRPCGSCWRTSPARAAISPSPARRSRSPT